MAGKSAVDPATQGKIKQMLWNGETHANVYRSIGGIIKMSAFPQIKNGRMWADVPWPDGSTGAMPRDRKSAMEDNRNAGQPSSFGLTPGGRPRPTQAQIDEMIAAGRPRSTFWWDMDERQYMIFEGEGAAVIRKADEEKKKKDEHKKEAWSRLFRAKERQVANGEPVGIRLYDRNRASATYGQITTETELPHSRRPGYVRLEGPAKAGRFPQDVPRADWEDVRVGFCDLEVVKLAIADNDPVLQEAICMCVVAEATAKLLAKSTSQFSIVVMSLVKRLREYYAEHPEDRPGVLLLEAR